MAFSARKEAWFSKLKSRSMSRLSSYSHKVLISWVCARCRCNIRISSPSTVAEAGASIESMAEREKYSMWRHPMDDGDCQCPVVGRKKGYIAQVCALKQKRSICILTLFFCWLLAPQCFQFLRAFTLRYLIRSNSAGIPIEILNMLEG